MHTCLVTPATVALDAAGVTYAVHEYDRSEELRGFGTQAAEQLGLDPDQVFKTLLVQVEGGAAPSDPVVVIVPVSSSVSMKAAAAAVGGKKATLCDPASAERITGYVVGGISPIGQRKPLVTIIDATVQRFDMIYVSGGRRGLEISLVPGALIKLLAAQVADITS